MKISKVKRNNQKRTKLSKQGKLKGRRHRPKKPQVQKHPVPKQDPDTEVESDDPEDLAEMIEEDDLRFLKNAAVNKSYDMLRNVRLKKRVVQDVEEKYEKSVLQSSEHDDKKSVKLLLPIKTKDGAIKKRVIEKEQSDSEEEIVPEVTEDKAENDESGQSEDEIFCEEEMEFEKPLNTANLILCREEMLATRRYTIGILSSKISDNPELQIKHVGKLIEFMDERNPEVYFTVRKLATASILEIFKEILPDYQILQLQQEGVKLKKDTLQLNNYETSLLRYYKKYLQKLEKVAGKLKNKDKTTKTTEEQIQLGILAVKCMCDLLVARPYFNFSTNISNFLCPCLDSKHSKVRELVSECFKEIFKTDKKGELTLAIVRRINGYVKIRKHSVRSDVIAVFLALRIKDINLDKEKEVELKKRKTMSHKERILSLSKRERKKSKKLEQVEKELLETKAEENKQAAEKTYTEITSVVFTIYFRILKQAPNSKILSACLEGLAKFAHCINIEFYEDVVNVLNELLNTGELGLREQLHCIQTVFTILSGQAVTLNIDPIRFYTHLFKNLLNIHAGKTQTEVDVVVQILEQALVTRHKNVTPNRILSFIKRMSTMALNQQQNGALAILCIIKMILQRSKVGEVLLDTDNTYGDGVYHPEIDDPEFTNAQCTSLWEIVALQRHYHPVVRSFAKNIAWETPATGEGALNPELAKLTPTELYNQFDPSDGGFNPAVPVPKKVKPKNITNHTFADPKFEEFVNSVYDKLTIT